MYGQYATCGVLQNVIYAAIACLHIIGTPNLSVFGSDWLQYRKHDTDQPVQEHCRALQDHADQT